MGKSQKDLSNLNNNVKRDDFECGERGAAANLLENVTNHNYLYSSKYPKKGKNPMCSRYLEKTALLMSGVRGHYEQTGRRP